MAKRVQSHTPPPPSNHPFEKLNSWKRQKTKLALILYFQEPVVTVDDGQVTEGLPITPVGLKITNFTK